MNLILLLVIGFLIFIGTYMILSVNLIRIVIGISIYTHAGNLIIMSMGSYGKNKTEPLELLTKILLTLCYKRLS